MKRYLILVVICILLTFIVPMITYYINISSSEKTIKRNPPAQGTVKVYFKQENTVRKMNVEDYLYGVVAAEMPATFELDALKAQVVAARSFIYYKKSNPSEEHPEADVCTDFAHCKAYKTEKELQKTWGKDKSVYSKKIMSAVQSTANEVITYNDEVAMAVFHSQAGGGKTENSEEVWGGKVPYLVSVESKWDENSPGFYSTVTYSANELQKLLSESHPEIEFENLSDFEVLELSEGGSVKNIRIGNVVLSGKEIRSILKLRSSCFKLSVNGEVLVFDVEGYGHGVGMSQYGANEMAKNGYNYVEILKHYYTDIEIMKV